MKRIFFCLSLFALALQSLFAGVKIEKDARQKLQTILDNGADLLLEPNTIYELNDELRLKKSGQKVYTKNAKSPNEYAVLKMQSATQTRLLNALQIPNIEIQNVAFDGSKFAEHELGNRDSLVQLGGHGGNNQKVKNCVFYNGRGWSLLHVFEPATNIEISENFFFSSGGDCRGGGAYKKESFPVWGDAISFAGQNSIVKNNVIIDPTDVGIVVYSCPNSIFEGNVVAAVSRESLGGIGMVDAIKLYEMGEGTKRYSYQNTLLTKNFVIALGARVHIAYAVGIHTWGPGPGTPPGESGIVLVGGKSVANEVSGKCAAYGFAISGAEDFEIRDNISTAQFSRIADGLTYKAPDEPCAFIYDEKTIKNCKLQKDFKKSQSHIIHLLACNFGKQRPDRNMFREYTYGESEAEGVIETAYLEMLTRKPTQKEFDFWKEKINKEFLPADAIRKELIKTDEFVKRFGEIEEDKMHEYRKLIWLEAYSKESQRGDWQNLSAKGKFERIWKQILQRTKKN